MPDLWRPLLTTDAPVARDVVSRDDCEVVLAARYHLQLSVNDRTFLRRVEDDFISSLHEAATGDGELRVVGQHFFDDCLARAEAQTTNVVILDDIYPARTPSRRFYSVNRVFDFASFPRRRVTFRSAGILDAEIASAPLLAPGEHVWVYDDGIFSGTTMLAGVEQLLAQGLSVDGVFAALGRISAVDSLSRSWQFERPIKVLGLQFTDGWDHCRDLIGVDGLRNEFAGYVPYWNIPDWISLSRIPTATVARLGRAHFSVLERYFAERHNLRFQRSGRNLIPILPMLNTPQEFE